MLRIYRVREGEEWISDARRIWGRGVIGGNRRGDEKIKGAWMRSSNFSASSRDMGECRRAGGEWGRNADLGAS